MVYDRKIKYFDYLEQGERLHGAGYIKMQRKDDKCQFEIMVDGLHKTDTFSVSVFAKTSERSSQIASLEIKNGCGKLLMTDLWVDNLAGIGISYEGLCEIWIPISQERELVCTVRDVMINETAMEEKKQEKTATEKTATGVIDSREANETKEVLEDQEPRENGEEHEVQELRGNEGEYKERENTETDEIKERITTNFVTEKKDEPGKPASDLHSADKKKRLEMGDNKWQYLQMVYEHIRPFRDEREYLSIGLSDFLIFSEQSYQLVHNSFLLHGFYNYHHLILHRYVQGGQVRFYVGVPGVLYEKEKQVARMYGFESFEGSGRFLSQGDFGYYMIPVIL